MSSASGEGATNPNRPAARTAEGGTDRAAAPRGEKAHGRPSGGRSATRGQRGGQRADSRGGNRGEPRTESADSQDGARTGRRRRRRGRPSETADEVKKPTAVGMLADRALAFPDEHDWDLDAPGDEAASKIPRGPSPFDPPTAPLDTDGDDVSQSVDPDKALPEGLLRTVVGVRIAGRIVDFDAGNAEVQLGDDVVVETDRGLTIGKVAYPPMRRVDKGSFRQLLRKVDRTDAKQLQRNQAREDEAMAFCKAAIREHDLPMKLVRVEHQHTANKAVFFFTAENRVDFRDLVKDLARELRSRIEMRQIGVRDGSKHTGGIGSCGNTLCCSSWLQDFDPVSIRMAKDQNLVLNPTKVSGQCGRLKCCLAYEEELYKEARRQLPKMGRPVSTPEGRGTVCELDIPRMLVTVRRDDGTTRTYPANLLSHVAPSETMPLKAQRKEH